MAYPSPASTASMPSTPIRIRSTASSSITNYDWEVYGPANPVSPLSLTQASFQSFKRALGPTELSYYLGSRGDAGVESGVNDMYLQIGFRAVPSSVTEARLISIWSQLIGRHALLGATVEFSALNDVKFCHEALATNKQRLARALELFEFKHSISGPDVVDHYLNGPRTLSDARLSYLLISTPVFKTELDTTEEVPFYFNLFSTHFIGDGMALHSAAHEFFTLLSTVPSLLTAEENDEIREDRIERMAHALESDIDVNKGWAKLAWAAATVDFEIQQAKLIGGHTFPRSSASMLRHTLTPSLSYSCEDTAQILKTCKAHGATIAHAVFALVNIAYIRSQPRVGATGEFPSLTYSALNLRGSLKGDKTEDWYRIAISYYNIILPTFDIIDSPAATFWLRAQSTKIQTNKIIKSSFLPSRAILMALERESRSIRFEKEDEMKRLGKGIEGLGISGVKLFDEEKVQVVEQVENGAKIPNIALMGVSMLGNLDGIYKHAEYTSVTLTSLATGSRQRRGAILLFAFTFNRKLEFSLGYDKSAFRGGAVEEWWSEVEKGVKEFLIV